MERGDRRSCEAQLFSDAISSRKPYLASFLSCVGFIDPVYADLSVSAVIPFSAHIRPRLQNNSDGTAARSRCDSCADCQSAGFVSEGEARTKTGQRGPQPILANKMPLKSIHYRNYGRQFSLLGHFDPNNFRSKVEGLPQTGLR